MSDEIGDAVGNTTAAVGLQKVFIDANVVSDPSLYDVQVVNDYVDNNLNPHNTILGTARFTLH